MIVDICELLGFEDLQELDVFKADGHRAISSNPHYFKDGMLYDCNDKPAYQALAKIILAEYVAEPVLEHLISGDKYYYCYLPVSYSEIRTISFDKLDDKCVMNLAIGNLFVREASAKANMDKIRDRMNLLRDGKAVFAKK